MKNIIFGGCFYIFFVIRQLRYDRKWVGEREREEDGIGKDSRSRIQTRDTRSATAWTHSCNIIFLSDWSDDVFCRGWLVRLQSHLNMNDSHYTYSRLHVTQTQVCVKALNIWLNNSTGSTEVVNIIHVPPHILGARLRNRYKVMLHVNQDAASVSPRPAPQRKLWVPSILCRVFMCLRVCECACNCSLAMLERSRGQIHRMVLNGAHNWSKLLLFHWFTDSTQRLHTVWALVISQSNRWLWLISLAIPYS